MTLGIFTKLGTTLAKQNMLDKPDQKRYFEGEAKKLMSCIAQVVEKDKGLSNLKGKSKEIEQLLKKAL